MILVTGATGFIGRSLVRTLTEQGYEVRVLIRPSKDSPVLPSGAPVEVAVASLTDPRGIRSALVGVDTVFHLAGNERSGARADLLSVDIQGTRVLMQMAADSGVKRVAMTSHLGADRASAYPLLKSKGIAEESLRGSGIDYTIFRTAVVFGRGDQFTTFISTLSASLPFFFIVPGDGDTVLQPLWVEDLVTCMAWSLDRDDTLNQVYEIGGPEYFSLRECAEMVMRNLGIERRFLSMRPPYLRVATVVGETLFSGLPISTFWIDYLATNRTTSLDTIPRAFGVLPSRFPSSLSYLKDTNWRRVFWRSVFTRQKPGINGTR